jgi:16S rRNA (cytosine1402-N4)-methyltransferase
MPDEVLALLNPQPGGTYLDGTLGGGGHAGLILEATAPTGRLIGLDRDPEALAAAGRYLEPFGERVTLVQANYSEMRQVLAGQGLSGVDGVLLDLGVSSRQLDTPERGFSFREDGPLDMRMGPDAQMTAADVVNNFKPEELRNIFREFGEERFAGRIANRIAERRADEPFRSTADLARVVKAAIPARHGARQKIHPATRVFQALRIFVNDELGHLSKTLAEALEVLNPDARFVVISFHSLEDRLVKRAFRQAAQGCTCPPKMPICICGGTSQAEIATRKGVRPTAEEVAHNPRARSAVVRAIRKLS